MWNAWLSTFALAEFLHSFGKKSVRVVGIDSVEVFDQEHIPNGHVKVQFLSGMVTNFSSKEETTEIQSLSGINVFDLITIFNPSLPQDTGMWKLLKDGKELFISSLLEQLKGFHKLFKRGGILFLSSDCSHAPSSEILSIIEEAGYKVVINEPNGPEQIDLAEELRLNFNKHVFVALPIQSPLSD